MKLQATLACLAFAALALAFAPTASAEELRVAQTCTINLNNCTYGGACAVNGVWGDCTNGGTCTVNLGTCDGGTCPINVGVCRNGGP